MAEQAERIEVTVRPIPPDTVSAAKEELVGYIERELREAGRGDLLATGQLRAAIEQTFPVDAAVMLGITVASRMAEEAFRQVVLPALKRRYGVEEPKAAKGKRRKQRKQGR